MKMNSEKKGKKENGNIPEASEEIIVTTTDASPIRFSPTESDADDERANHQSQQMFAHSNQNGHPTEVEQNIPLGPVSLSPGDSLLHHELTHELSQWLWVDIDDCRLPSILRNGEKYLAVHMVQLNLLSKFPPNIPSEMSKKYTMVSHKMTSKESMVFNTVNAVMSKFKLGCQLFNTNDEVVKLSDVHQFYWNVKELNLLRIVRLYTEQLDMAAKSYNEESEDVTSKGTNLSFIAAMTQLKKSVELDLEAVRAELQKLSCVGQNEDSEVNGSATV